MPTRVRALSVRDRALLGLAIVATIAFVAATWWVIGARTYNDLELGSTTSAGSDGRIAGDEFFDHEQVVLKRFRAGKITTFGVSVRNAGGRDVTLTGVGPQRQFDDQKLEDRNLSPRGVQMNPRDGTGTPEKTVPFRPFVLHP